MRSTGRIATFLLAAGINLAAAAVVWGGAQVLAGDLDARAEETAPLVPNAPLARSASETVSRPSSRAQRRAQPREFRYIVRPGDTLSGIAARNYVDAGAGMRRIKRRNGLRREAVFAGEVLLLPAPDRR